MSFQGTYIKQPNGYKAFIPSPLPPEPSLDLDQDLMKKNEQAALSLARLDGLAHLLPNLDLLIAMYVKKEALLSSQIEGTQASLVDVLEYENGIPVENITDVKEVINYIKAMNYGIERLKTLPMSIRLIKEIHTILLENTRGKDKAPGEFKRTQNWIGAGNVSLNDAVFIPPPPEETKQAMSDLEKYMHESSVYSELINCGLIHYQFETIHPFLDGNGRLGRLLITFHLYWKGIITKPILYSSYYFKKRRTEYYDRLMIVRNTGNYEQWIKFFLTAIHEASESAIDTTRRILTLKDKDQNILYKEKLSSPIAVMLLNKLFETPIISVKDVEEHFNISYPTAALLVKQFLAAKILQEITGQKRAKRFVYTEYMDILSEGTAPYQ